MFEVDLKDNSTVEKIVQECWLDTGKYGKYFYPDRFSLPFTHQHKAIFETIDAKVEWRGKLVPKYNKIVIKGWRGLGKTTIAKTVVAKRARYVDSMLIVYIGKSHDFAALQTEAIKRGMMQNPLESKIFGSIKFTPASRDIQETFSKKAWVTNSGVLVVPRGCRQPVRGLLHDWGGKSYRAGLIVIDDLEDPLMISSEDYRRESKEWLLGDVVKAVPLPEVDMDWQVIYIDTLKHEDSVLQMLIDSPDWKALDFSACTQDFDSLVPEYVSTEAIKREVEAHRSRGTLDVFYREMMGIPFARETAEFRIEYFKYYDESSKEFLDELKKGEVESVVLVDPAKTVNRTSAESAVVGVGVNVVSGRIYVRDIVRGRFHPDDLYAKVFQMAESLRARVIGLEVNSLEEFIEYPFRNAMLERGLNYEIVKLRPRRFRMEGGEDRSGGKIGRIGALAPLYRQGQIYHNKAVCAPLEIQLLSFPRPKHWDVMDAFAYIIQLLDEGCRYFEPRDVETSPEDIEAEYRELEMMDEPPLKGWRLEI